MRLAWLTDIHVNFLNPAQRAAFFDAVASTAPDAVLVGGDTGEADDVFEHLAALAERLACPVFFVLGNHDYYGGAIAAVRQRAKTVAGANPLLRWLPSSGVVALGDGAALVGVDGWADARAGDFERSPVMLNDYLHIADLVQGDRKVLERTLLQRGDEEAAALRALLSEALKSHRRVIVLTHVPPFPEACWHEGRLSDDDWQPHFTCVATGEVLRELAAANPESEVLVLCGHTHGEGEARILPTLLVRTGGAEYGRPEIQRVVDSAAARLFE